MATAVEQVLEKLLGGANNELAIAQQQLVERQQSGKNVRAASAEVGMALARVEALQEGVNYTQPTSEPEKSIASLGAQMVAMCLDGEGAAQTWLPDLLKTMERLHKYLPDEDKKRFFLARQGAPYVVPGQKEPTPTTVFPEGREIIAESEDEAIKILVEAGDECADPYGETPPIEDGEVLVVLGMKNRVVDTENIWVERVERPVFKGVAPHDNTKYARHK